jgi:hypothetical protein
MEEGADLIFGRCTGVSDRTDQGDGGGERAEAAPSGQIHDRLLGDGYTGGSPVLRR